jgi:outer membrane protein TolC
MKRAPLYSCFVLLGEFIWSAAAHAQVVQRRLAFNEAVRLAVQNGPEIVAAAAGVTATEARIRSASAQRFPTLHTDANIQYWDKALDINFMGVPGMPAMGAMAPAGQSGALRVRDQLTSQVSVTLAQPLSGLLVLGRLIALERYGRNAAQADAERARLDTAQRAAEAYLRALQAKALHAVAEQSVRQVEAQLERATILESGGVLQHVDVLRLSAARDNAKQSLLRAAAGVETAGEALALALDLPTETPIEVVDDLPDPPPAITVDAPELVAAAQKQRPEIVGAHERTDQARAGEGVATARLWPNVLAVATYQHTEGQSTFQPKNAWFIGATLSWDVWDWGKNWDGIKEAEARSSQAQISARMLQNQIVFDVRRRLLEVRTTYETLGVGRSALEAAEEAYRIQSVRYHEGGATTTDLLDSEIDVFRARSAYSQARYDYYLSQAGLARAVGRLPTQQIGGTHAVR